MSKMVKFLLNGTPAKQLFEGAFSEIHVQLTDQLEDIRALVQRAGDFQFGNSINPNYTIIKQAFDEFIQELDKYNLKARQFVDSYVKENPNVSYQELLNVIEEKFL